MAALERRQCGNHPDRYGHALCMACNKTLCQECATSWDGINYCASCMATRRKTAGGGSSTAGWIAAGAAAALLAWLAPKALLWGSVLLARTLN